MSKQVKTPRFYVDIPTFLHATGELEWDGGKGGAELLYMNPSNPYIREFTSATVFRIGKNTNRTIKTSFGVNFAAVLNHNLAKGSIDTEGDEPGFKINGIRGKHWENDDNDDWDWENLTTGGNFGASVLNSNQGAAGRINPDYNGTSIFTLSSTVEGYWRQFDVRYDGNTLDSEYNHQLGSLVVGRYWDAPHSPDLNLTMSRRFDGIKRQKTIGGKTLANIYYDGPTEWTMNGPEGVPYKYPPFELDTTHYVDTEGHRIDYRAKSGLGRKGLRSWKLTFSYISDDDMWMDNEVSSKLTADNIADDDSGSAVANPMLSDDSFNFVWNVTLGGTLPFIFQPDNSVTGTNPDRFSICTFRENTLSVKQVAHNTYSLSITIDEVA